MHATGKELIPFHPIFFRYVPIAYLFDLFSTRSLESDFTRFRATPKTKRYSSQAPMQYAAG